MVYWEGEEETNHAVSIEIIEPAVSLQLYITPSYAGVNVYGRYRDNKTINSDSHFEHQPISFPTIEDWKVFISDHHLAYLLRGFRGKSKNVWILIGQTPNATVQTRKMLLFS